MSWAPIYIRGRKGFQEVVATKLQMMWLPGSTENEINVLMYWLPKIGELRNLKKTIGSRLIFKYRMHFITDLDFHLNQINRRPTYFSAFENRLINTKTLDIRPHQLST